MEVGRREGRRKDKREGGRIASERKPTEKRMRTKRDSQEEGGCRATD